MLHDKLPNTAAFGPISSRTRLSQDHFRAPGIETSELVYHSQANPSRPLPLDRAEKLSQRLNNRWGFRQSCQEHSGGSETKGANLRCSLIRRQWTKRTPLTRGGGGNITWSCVPGFEPVATIRDSRTLYPVCAGSRS
jgi:hypothetical protein